MDAGLKTNILEILTTAPDMTIATVRDDGYPHATTVSFVSDGLTIYFGCGRTSQKVSNIRRNDRVSITVNRPYSRWDEIRGLSLAGRARAVTDPAELRRVGRLMAEKFPQLADFVALDMDETEVFRVVPQVVSVLDYREGFGHTDLVHVPESALPEAV